MILFSPTIKKVIGPVIKGLYFAFIAVLFLGCGSSEQQPLGTGPITGVISASQLMTQYPQFRSAYDHYQPSPTEIDGIKTLSGKSLVVLFGTWCHDSEREVPRLLKLLDLSGVELKSLSLHGVNYNKQEPTNLHRQYNLKYSPTIILLQGEVELGRVVVKPIVNLGIDLAAFIIE